jgi:hypothetical protein
MATPQGITQFYSAAQKQDFARSFQYRVEQLGSLIDPDILVYMESATLPGRTIANIPVPFMGLQFNVPGTASYPNSDGWSITFRCDQEYKLRSILEDASFNVFDESISGGSYKTPPASQSIVINLLGKDINVAPIRQYRLVGAYLTNIGQASYDIGDNGSVVKIECTMAYQYWEVTQNGSSSSWKSMLKNMFPF